MKKSSASAEASPYKSVAEELERLRKAFRTLNQRYTARVESEIAGLRDRVLASAGASAPVLGTNGGHLAFRTVLTSDDKPSAAKRPSKAQAAKVAETSSQFHDLRDMLMLLRNFEITSGVARRKDLKRVESLVEELQLLARYWA